MGMSHAAAVWIPGTDVAPATIEQLIRDSCQHVGLKLDLFVREDPATTVALAPLDDSPFQMDFGLLNGTAAALARALQRRTYALYGFFGSGDWMIVTAFDEEGEVAWSEASADDLDAGDAEHVLEKLEHPAENMNALNFPYWTLMSDVAPGCASDLLGVGLEPAFDLGAIDGWSAVRAFETPGRLPETIGEVWAEFAAVRATEKIVATPVKKKKSAAAPKKVGAKAPKPKKKKTSR